MQIIKPEERVALLLSLFTQGQIDEIGRFFMTRGYQGIHEIPIIQQNYRTDLESLAPLDSKIFTRDVDKMADMMRAISVALDSLFVTETQEDTIELILRSSLGLDEDVAEDVAEDIMEAAEKGHIQNVLNKET